MRDGQGGREGGKEGMEERKRVKGGREGAEEREGGGVGEREGGWQKWKGGKGR